MNSSNFNKFIEDFSSISSSDSSNFERILRKHPYFQTAALFLAKSNPIQENTQKAALRSADRRILRTWLDEEYRKELEKEKQDLEAKKIALELENDENQENLDIDTESINAFDKFVETNSIQTEISEIEQQIELKSEEVYQEMESKIEENNDTSTNSFFDDLEENEEVEKITSTLENTANFFDEVDEDVNEIEEEPIFKEQSNINESLPTEIISEIPPTTTDANFFDEVDESEKQESIFKEQSDINENLLDSSELEIPAEATDANFFDEVESDDEIFGDAQKDLDNYNFPDFEEDTKENNKKSDDTGSFFDEI